jgi:hypothetical protein
MQRLSRLIALGYIAICLLALAGRALIGPIGYTPFPVVAGPARPPIAVTIWYSSEKKDWLEAAAARFAATSPTYAGRPIQIQFVGMDSREMAERAAARNWGGAAPPTALSPASGFWLAAAGVPVAETPRSLALSPLVVVGWEERASALWPGGPGDLWGELHGAIANPEGWRALGGQEQWGPVKLGHARPTTSNSGVQALILMAYGFFGKSGGLTSADISNPEFQLWLADLESGVPTFSDSSSGFMNDMVLAGPSKYDFAVIYENLALRSMDAALSRQNQALRIFYPPATLLSDHPFAALAGDWVQPEERAVANQFRDFLLTRPIQELALQYGFRPADPGVSIESGDPNNPFRKYAQNGAQTGISTRAEEPSPDVVEALIELWQTRVNR